MSGVKVLYRVLQEVPAQFWLQKLELEKRLDEAEAALGYPNVRRFRPLFGREHSDTVRVENRIFESYAKLGQMLEERAANPVLRELDSAVRAIVREERKELFYVDSGSPVPRWMQAVARKKLPAEKLSVANDEYPVPPLTAQTVQENIAAGKLRILYRLIQEVPKDRWTEKLEQERRSDLVERASGHPLPMRYRAMFGSEHSQIRVNEREYDSYAAFCRGMEAFLDESDPANQDCMDAEIQRQEFFVWEREEIYIVDSDSFVPRWMHYAALEQQEG